MITDLEGKLIDDRFKIREKIGEGSFGAVYKAKDIQTKHKVALKLETNPQGRLQLLNEIQAYTHLSHIEGIPKLIQSGRIEDLHYLAIDLLKSSLTHYFSKHNNKFSLGCVLNISLQLLQRLEDIHNSSYIHRDIKPSNLMTGRNKRDNILYLIDFGLCKKFRDPITKQHSLYGEDRQMIGNLKYCSYNAQMGVEQSRRDDLESWFYLQVSLLIGKMPWDGELRTGNSFSVLKSKSSTTCEELCAECPKEFLAMIKHIKSLHFEEKPNYELLRNSVKSILERVGISAGFDWIRGEGRRKTNGLLAVKKEVRDRRRGSELVNLEGITHLAKELDMQDSSLSSKGSKNDKKPSIRKNKKHMTKGSNVSVDTSQHSGISNASSFNEEKKEQDLRTFERMDTLKNIYPEFHKKHVNFVDVEEDINNGIRIYKCQD